MTTAVKTTPRDEKTPEDLLREEIVADAKRQAERLLRKASRESAELAEKSRAAAGRECEKVLANARAVAARRAGLLRAKVPVEEGRYRAARIEEQLDAVRESASAKLSALPVTAGLLARLVGDAARACGGGDLVVSLSEADRAVLEGSATWREDASRAAGVASSFSLSDGGALPPSSRGPLVSSADGSAVCDNRLGVRLARLWPSLRRVIAGRLGYVDGVAGGRP